MAKFIGSINDATILDLGAFSGLVLIVIDSSWLAFLTFITFGIGFYIEERYGFVEEHFKKAKNKHPVEVEDGVFEAKSSTVKESAVPPQRDIVEEISKEEEACQMELNVKESQEPGAYEEIMRQYDQSSPPANDDVEDDDCFRKTSDMVKQRAKGENVEEVREKAKEGPFGYEQEKGIQTREKEIVEVQAKSENEQEASVAKPKVDEGGSTLSKVENLLRRSSSHSSVSSAGSDNNEGDFAEEESTKSSGDFVKVTEELTKSSEEHVEPTEKSTTSSESLEKIDPTKATEDSDKESSKEPSISAAEESAEAVAVGEPAEILSEKIIDTSGADIEEKVPVPSRPTPLFEKDQIIEDDGPYANTDPLRDVSDRMEASAKEPLEGTILTGSSQTTDKTIRNSIFEGESQEFSTKEDAADKSAFASDSSSFNVRSTGPTTYFTTGKDSIKDKSPSPAFEQSDDNTNRVSDNQAIQSHDQRQVSERSEVTSVEGKNDSVDVTVEGQKEAVTDVYWAGHERETGDKNELSYLEDVVDQVLQKSGDGLSVEETQKTEGAQSSPTNNDPAGVDQPSKSEPGQVSAMVLNAEAVVQSKDLKDEAEFQ